MRGTMEDDVWAFVFENRGDSLLVADVGEAGTDVGADPALAQFAINFEEGIFSALDQDQAARTKFHRLATDFRADGAACAGDEDGFTCQESLEFGGVETDGLAAQQIEDIDAGARL